MRSLDDLSCQGKVVLVRSDLNTPVEQLADGTVRITDDGRIRAALPTIVDLVQRGARVVVLSHLGRPKGKPEPNLTLLPVAQRLGELLGQPVAFSPQTVGPVAQSVVAKLTDGDVAVVENVRFHAAETSKDDQERGEFADEIAELGEFFVGDGFGVSHRKHASVYDIALRLPSAAGRLIEQEVEVLQRLVNAKERPYVVVLGGSKVSDKLAVIEAFLSRADRILIGGGMVYTFLAAKGFSVGESLLEPDLVATCASYLEHARERGVTIELPSDIVVADRFAADAQHRVVSSEGIESGWMGLDIGPDSSKTFALLLADAQTVFWNGPMGVFEFDAFASGTAAIAKAMSDSAGFTVVGGGDSAAAVRHLGFAEDCFGYISTGGGASLEYLEGRELPGLRVLEDK
ncbi:MAG: phosphoglycerate kinase [Actinomycetes bacterium]